MWEFRNIGGLILGSLHAGFPLFGSILGAPDFGNSHVGLLEDVQLLYRVWGSDSRIQDSLGIYGLRLPDS